MRGRKPIPTYLKILRGNPGKRALNHDEPVPVGNLIDPPDWMSEAQKAGWNYAIENAPLGLLRKLDCSVLTTWVVAEDLHRKATQQLERSGLLVKSPNAGVPIQSPFLPIVNKQASLMIKAAEQLGFTPASRSRIQLIEAFTDEDDEWAERDRRMSQA